MLLQWTPRSRLVFNSDITSGASLSRGVTLHAWVAEGRIGQGAQVQGGGTDGWKAALPQTNVLSALP